jgi:hypothetical protein
VGNAAWRSAYNRQGAGSNILENKTFRLAAAGDLVPLVPGLLDGYRHVGQEVFLRGEGFRRDAKNSGRDARAPQLQINPNHLWEMLCDELRTMRALRRFNLDFILQFHSLDEDYLPLLDGGLTTKIQRHQEQRLLTTDKHE